MRLAYKFLATGRVGRFSRFRWPEPAGEELGEWVHAGARLQVCADAIHACRARDLPLWLDDELWVIELAGETIEADTKIAAASGRLVRRVRGWTGEAASDLAFACALRARDHALRAIRSEGLRAESSPLSEAFTPREIHARASEFSAHASGVVSTAAGFAMDAGKLASDGAAATTAYVATHAAAHMGGPTAMAGERAWQVDWLVDRLAIDPHV